MSKLIDMTGKTVGNVYVIKRVKNNKWGEATFECKCNYCNKNFIISGSDLRKRKIDSCGCTIYHGLRHTRIHKIWTCMKQRCNNPNNDAYHNYGGRGIYVCDEWLDDVKAFHKWAIKNGYKETLTIDRIDNDGPYSPDNCRWVTRKVQCNNVRTNRVIKYKGVEHTLSEWSDITGIPYKKLQHRINKLGPEKAMGYFNYKLKKEGE